LSFKRHWRLSIAQTGRPGLDKIHLIDFGLACRFWLGTLMFCFKVFFEVEKLLLTRVLLGRPSIADPNGHTAYKEDPKLAHDGTLEFTCVDAHNVCANLN
jgi:hypothetical protein